MAKTHGIITWHYHMAKQPLFFTIEAVFKNPKLANLNEEEEREGTKMASKGSFGNEFNGRYGFLLQSQQAYSLAPKLSQSQPL